jgi:hypothetical protein
MKMINILKDKRNPIYFSNLFKYREKNKDIDSINFSFTLDLENHNNSKFNDKQLDLILDFLKDYGKGTFFVETSLLEKNEINLEKNEIGSHGYGHLGLGDNWWINEKEKSKNIEKNIFKSTQLIKDKFGINPISFRCPKFSKSEKVNNILIKAGYKIDSSSSIHNEINLPFYNKNIFEIPVSRYYKPVLRFKKIIPYLKYNSLIFSNLKEMGLNKFLNLSNEIVWSWPKEKKPLLNFACHNWDFKTNFDLDLIRSYLNKLENNFKVKFLSLKEYCGVVGHG